MKRSIALAGLAAGLLLAAASPAAAGGRVGELVEKDPAASTLTIGRRVYQVTERTVLRGYEGQRITLAEVPVPLAGAEPALRPVVEARYEAVTSRGALVLVSLDLVSPRH